MNYGVVIVTYNRLELLKECIYKVENQTIKPNRIVIVNNNSTDGTTEYLDTKKNANFIVEHVTTNKGSSYGFSRGVEVLRDLDVEWQLIIDDDAILEEDYVEQISKFISDKYKAYSGTVMQNGEPAIHHRRRFNDKNVFKEISANVPKEEYEKETFEYDIMSFCGLLINNEVVKQIDLPKQELFTQFTDTEYSTRLRKITKVLNVNSAKLNHKVNPSRKDETMESILYNKKRNIYMQKNICTSVFI